MMSEEVEKDVFVVSSGNESEVPSKKKRQSFRVVSYIKFH